MIKIVLGTGMPQCAINKYATIDEQVLYHPKRFWAGWKEYCKKIAEKFGENIYFYQILNEEDHPIIGDTASEGKLHRDHEETAFKVAYESLAVYDTNFETIVNVYTDWPNWAKRLEEWSSGIAKDYIDILAIYHYPGTWTWDRPPGKDWGPLGSLINICNKYNKKGAIMETGFSTWGSEDSWWGTPGYEHTEDDQEIFINNALPIIKSKVSNHNTFNSGTNVVLACWYELRGSEPYGSLNVEHNFGVLRDDWSSKRGYDDLQKQIETFYTL